MDNRIRARQRRAQRKGDAEHKLARSCRSIGEAASLALADCDEWQELDLIHVVDVMPEPGSGRVMVLVAPARPLSALESERVEEALE
ncbi:MAG TPA: hypothetical protein VM686_14930, partial [Polyangiaceae bacterium]|nr:hypothetical protein [Polyangiaceae bacterium]